MKISKHLVSVGSETLDYFVHSKETDSQRTTVLRMSVYGNWTAEYKGKVCVAIGDDDTGVDITVGEHRPFRLTYSEYVELQQAMKYHYSPKYKALK